MFRIVSCFPASSTRTSTSWVPVGSAGDDAKHRSADRANHDRGVTTVVSPLGADSLTRSIPCLLARAATLECEGISAFCYTGGWWDPVPTLSGNPQADVAFVDRILA